MSPFRENALLPRGDARARLRGHVGTLYGRARQWLENHKPFGWLVILPTLVVAAYYLLIAAPQYLSEAHFVVLGSPQPSKSDSGMGQMMSSGPSDPHTLAVIDFLQSHDAVAALGKTVDLKTIYRKPLLDVPARLRSNPTLEELYNYLYKRSAMVHVSYDFMSFVGVIKVYAFAPQDAQQVADHLLKLGDQLVDRLNQRSLDDALKVSREEVKRAEARVAAVGDRITNFRVQQHELDYNRSADTILDVISKLEANLAQARSDLDAARPYMQPDSARFIELGNNVKAIEAQIEQQKARLTGKDGALAPEMASYERLMLERNFANQDYERAARALEDATLQAQRQQLFLVRTVDAKPAEKSEYPRSFIIILTVFVTLTVAYGIGWLILAGVKEHAG